MFRSPVSVVIAGTGHYVPAQVWTNDDLVGRFGLDSTDEWIRSHVGVVERRWAADGEATSDLAVEAGRRALEAAGVPPGDLARIVLGTSSGDWPSPATACAVQHRLGARCPAEDKVAACSGFLFGLDHGARLVATGDAPVLIIGADCKSRFIDRSDRRTCPIFADGAGAVVLVASEEAGRGVLDMELYSDGAGAENVCVPAGGSRLPASEETVRQGLHGTKMKDGRDVFQNAILGMTLFARAVLDRQGLTAAEVDWMVPHQANRFIIERVAAALGVPLEKTVINIDRYGNTVAATIPIALDELVRSGRVRRGDRILFVCAGAGYTGGALLYRW
jgi:3-oxoacyl-[acyl-carrier-protein] synthase-3